MNPNPPQVKQVPARSTFIYQDEAVRFSERLPWGCIDLLCIDPPYYEIVKQNWDRRWRSPEEFVSWFLGYLAAIKPAMSPRASLVFFGGTGSEGSRPFFDILSGIERHRMFRFRNLITWGKRRGYGKPDDYLFTREEIAWYSVDSQDWTYHVPYTQERRGYKGFNKKYPAKSEFKRVTNVWTDIGELMRPERECQKPLPLLDRLIQVHSNPGDVVCDTFAGWGTTGVSAVQNGRDFVGCEEIDRDAATANERTVQAFQNHQAFRTPKTSLIDWTNPGDYSGESDSNE